MLTLYLSPIRNLRRGYRYPPRNWILILAPSNTDKCTFYHVKKIEDVFDGRPPTYENILTREKVPLDSPPVSTELAMLNKVATLAEEIGELVLRLADLALESEKNAYQGWAVTFLQVLEDEGLVGRGVSVRYKIECEGEVGEVDELMGRMDIEELDFGPEEKGEKEVEEEGEGEEQMVLGDEEMKEIEMLDGELERKLREMKLDGDEMEDEL
ncbi:hypothetical protein BJX61DRAFT_52830 [Aspergillus egyptiacus]|nr:hypothetical protein BJX61DRAFT_52830 [Aspergillus egyptiacus]